MPQLELTDAEHARILAERQNGTDTATREARVNEILSRVKLDWSQDERSFMKEPETLALIRKRCGL